MHILIIHQAFASLGEPGGTRHYELARYLTERGHRVTVIASPVSYITGNASVLSEPDEGGVRVLRARVYAAHHKSFLHRMLAFFSFMFSSFWLFGVKGGCGWGTAAHLQGVTACAGASGAWFRSKCAICGPTRHRGRSCAAAGDPPREGESFLSLR
jgi:hypothetical protein